MSVQLTNLDPLLVPVCVKVVSNRTFIHSSDHSLFGVITDATGHGHTLLHRLRVSRHHILGISTQNYSISASASAFGLLIALLCSFRGG